MGQQRPLALPRRPAGVAEGRDAVGAGRGGRHRGGLALLLHFLKAKCLDVRCLQLLKCLGRQL